MKASKLKQAFLVGLAVGAVGAFAHGAEAWTRTVQNRSLVSNAIFNVSFPSDGVSGTPNGNSATAIYADFYVVGTGSATIELGACGYAYNATAGGCGAATTATYAASANGTPYDIFLAKWIGTNSQWDYFSVFYEVTSAVGSATVYSTGIGVSGT